MKKLLQRPGFEAIFSLTIGLLIILPALVFAQGRNNLTIIINNGDTTVNGKKMKDLGPGERFGALRSLSGIIKPPPPPRMNTNLSTRLIGRDSTRNFFYHTDSNGVSNVVTATYSRNDLNYNAPDRIPTKRPDMSQYRMPVMRPHDNDLRNKQDFDYNSVDKDGIVNRLNYHVTIPDGDMIKKLSGTEFSNLEITDLVFTPEFSTGRTLISLNLPAKLPADITFSNSDGKQLWSEKVTADKFSRSFLLPLNGVYYLVIKQGMKTAVRKVVRE